MSAKLKIPTIELEYVDPNASESKCKAAMYSCLLKYQQYVIEIAETYEYIIRTRYNRGEIDIESRNKQFKCVHKVRAVENNKVSKILASISNLNKEGIEFCENIKIRIMQISDVFAIALSAIESPVDSITAELSAIEL